MSSRKCAAALSALLSSTTAMAAAQPVPAAQPAAEAPSEDGSDIIVTAQRRSERARDVPISLTALGEKQLQNAGITDTRGLTMVTPGLKMDRVGNFTLPALRGVTTTITNPGADANVAVYLDGIYQPSTLSNTFDLPDVERVEVIKGPQGTLFGRNATGGAIQVFTRAPSYTPEGMASVGYSSFNTFTAKGFVSGPVVPDKVAVSLAGFYEKGDTYYHNLRTSGPGLSGTDSVLVRGKIRIDPVDGVRLTVTGRYSDRKESLAIYGAPLNGNSVARLLDPTAIIPTRPYDAAVNNEATPQRVKFADVSGRLEIDTETGTLTSLTGYLNARTTDVLDADYAYTPNGKGVNYFVSAYDKYFTQELNYASHYEGQFNFVVGAFYTKGQGGYDPIGVQTPTFSVSIYGKQHVESLAGFGEIYYDLTDKLSAIGGLRYSWERRSLESALLFGGVALPPPPLTERGRKNWASATPRFSLRYKLTPTSNVYFTFSQGFKSGVYNTTSTTSDLANPERLTAYEVGFKGKVSEGLSLNLAGFYYDYKDLQANVYTSINGVPLSLLRNAASARIYGFETDATATFSPAFDMRMAISVLDAKYKSFASASVLMPCTNIPATGGCSTIGTPTNTGNATTAYDASGQGMIRAPSFTASVTANAHIPLAGSQLDLSGTVYYSSRLNFTFNHRIFQPAYATVDARASWKVPDTGLTLSVFGRNLTNHTVISGTFIAEPSDGVSYAPPRSYGGAIEYRF